MRVKAAVTGGGGGGMAVACAPAIAGCGLGPGQGTSDVTVTVTKNFGATRVAQATEKRVPGSETVMRVLERHFNVSLRYGGGFVESINGSSGSSARRDWFYYVNGIEAPRGAATTSVHHGDRIWWDLHDWTATDSVPAVVGSFPEPFLHGSGGRRFPTVLQCAADVSAACKRVSDELSALGVPVASAEIGTGSGTDSLGVVVGTWHDIRPEIVASLLAQGPGASGVYARFSAAGGALTLLDPSGRPGAVLGPGAGLVAATSQNSSVPTWLITGTDVAGVQSAAAALTPSALRDHFALAVQGARRIPIPVRSAS
jgi:Domain of unknown function (DUF4430)